MSTDPQPRSAAPRRLRLWLNIALAVTAVHLMLLWLASPDGPIDSPLQTAAPEPVVIASLLAPDMPPARPAAVTARPPPATTPGRDSPATTEHQATPGRAEANEARSLRTAHDETSDPIAPHPDATPAPSPSTEAAPPTPAIASVTAPASARLQYEVAGRSKDLRYGADAVLDWRQDGQHYQATLEISAFLLGSRSQTSSGRLGAGGLQPERFMDRTRKDRLTTFDYEAVQIRPDSSPARPMPPGTQDKLSVFLQLARQLAGLGRPPTTADRWTLPVAASNRVESWTFDYRGSEALSLPAGPITAWHFERQASSPGETAVELWLAPELGFLPVRLRLGQGNGDSVDLSLSRR